MTCHRPLLVLASLALVVGAWWAPAGAQDLALSARKPRFIEAWGRPGRAVDVSRAAVLWRRVSLDLTGVPVDTALRVIARDAGLELAYTQGVVPGDRRVSIHAQEITVASALTEVLLGMPVDVAVGRTGQLAIVRATEPLVAPEPRQTGAVVGRVSDGKTGAALAGATVGLDGTRHSATTGSDGRYRIAEVAPARYTVRARYIGYTPGAVTVSVDADQEAIADFGLDKSAQRLNEVVTTGTVVPTEVKALPTPVSVVSGDDMRAQNLTSVDQIFRGTVPAMVSYDFGANTLYAGLTSIRGSQYLGGSLVNMKTYVDGVELANPIFFLANLDPSGIDHVEVIRGPQAATVYGSNASGGVIQVFTKKGTASGQPALSGHALVGVIQAPYAPGTPLRQDYAVDVTGGKPGLTYSAGASYQYDGAVVPANWSRVPALYGAASLTQGRVTVDLTARYSDRRLSYAYPPQFATIYPPYGMPSYLLYASSTQTYGLTASYRATPRWQHQLTLGYDGNPFQYWQTQPALSTPADTFLSAGSQTFSKSSIRYNTSFDVPLGRAISGVITAGAEYSRYSSDYFGTYGATTVVGSLDGTLSASRTLQSNTGYFGQLQLGVVDRFFVTGGLRAERNDGFGDNYGTAWQPRVGASYVQPLGWAVVKLRGSWGDALQVLDPTQKTALVTPLSIQLANLNLAPPRQSGWDTGVDLQLGAVASVGVTYYRQVVKDLVDYVNIGTSGTIPEYQYQNAARVKNRGWEFEGNLDLGRVAVHATFAPVTSTVAALSPKYTGVLRIGDTVLGIPRRSAGAALSWTPLKGTTAILGMTYIGQWTAADYLALYQYYLGLQPYRGSDRDYWIEYPSVTKFNFSFSQRLAGHLAALLQVDNLGNNLRYESDNFQSIPIGRTTSVGLRFQ